MANQQRAGRKSDDDAVASYEQELADYLKQRIKPGLNSGAIPLLARSIAKELAHREHPNGASEKAEADADGEADDEPTAEGDDAPSGEEGDEPTAEEDDVPTGEEDEEPTAEEDEEAGDEADDEPSAEAGEDDDEDEADDEPSAEADEDEDEADDEPSAEADEDEDGESSDFEADMHELQEELGEDWILRFSVHGDDAWLTAETQDGTQRVEAPTAGVIAEAVQLINEGGGRSS